MDQVLDNRYACRFLKVEPGQPSREEQNARKRARFGDALSWQVVLAFQKDPIYSILKANEKVEELRHACLLVLASLAMLWAALMCWFYFVSLHVPGSKLLILGMVIPPLIGNPYNGYINPYEVYDHPYSYHRKTMGVYTPSTYDIILI